MYKHPMQVTILVLLATVAIVLATNDFLSERPQSFVSCRRKDTNFKFCYAKNIEVIFREWKNGIPGLKSIGTLDPLRLKRFVIRQRGAHPLQMNLHDVTVTGLSRTEVKDVDLDMDKLIFNATIKEPNLEIEYDFNVQGEILKLALNGEGKGLIKINDVTLQLIMHYKLRDEYGHTFADIVNLQLKLVEIAGLHIEMKNLFNGQKDLEDATNAAINQNWRSFFTILAPSIEKAIAEVLLGFFKKLNAYVPKTYFLEDFPKAAEFYG